MAINGSGIWDTVRVLGISPTTVINDQRIKKKQEDVKVVNYRLLEQLDVETIDVDLYLFESAEMDEMWSFVGSKKQQR